MAIRKSIIVLFSAVFSICIDGASTIAQIASAGESELDAPISWVTDYANEIEAQVERFTSAYNLSPDAQEALRADLKSRMIAQWKFETENFKQIQAEIDQALKEGVDFEQDHARDEAIMAKVRMLSDTGPLNDMVIAQSIEANMTQEAAQAGKSRLVELINRRDRLASVVDDDLEQVAAHNSDIVAAQKSATAPISAVGNPLPRGEKLTEVAPGAVGKAGGEMPAASAISPGAGAVGRDSAEAAKAAAMGAVMPAGVGGADAAGASGAAGTDAQAARIAAELKAAADAAAALEEAKKAQAEALAGGGGAAAGNGAVVNPKSAKRAAERVEAARIAAEKAESELAAAKGGPNGNGADSGKVRSGARHDANGRESAARPMPKVEAVRATQAPPLDDWDKHVDATCKKFDFSDAQVIKAQSILKDLRQRAEAYRKSRDSDFAAADRIAEAKAKADRKAELAKPIDALFEELKQRLDNLATAEQRAKAAAEPAKGAKK